MAQQDEQLEQLKRKYQPALNAIQQQGVRLHHLHIQNGKLFLQGEAPSNEAKNRVWDAIKGVDHTYSDLTADITINPSLAPPAPQPATQSASAPAAAAQTYTVQPGDNLSKISKQFYGDANKYMRIFEANRDQLQDPNKIKAGQVLKIPA